MTDQEKWAKIQNAWITYCHEGASAFDWDYDSRDLMRELTGHRAFEGSDDCQATAP